MDRAELLLWAFTYIAIGGTVAVAVLLIWLIVAGGLMWVQTERARRAVIPHRGSLYVVWMDQGQPQGAALEALEAAPQEAVPPEIEEDAPQLIDSRLAGKLENVLQIGSPATPTLAERQRALMVKFLREGIARAGTARTRRVPGWRHMPGWSSVTWQTAADLFGSELYSLRGKGTFVRVGDMGELLERVYAGDVKPCPPAPRVVGPRVTVFASMGARPAQPNTTSTEHKHKEGR